MQVRYKEKAGEFEVLEAKRVESLMMVGGMGGLQSVQEDTD